MGNHLSHSAPTAGAESASTVAKASSCPVMHKKSPAPISSVESTNSSPTEGCPVKSKGGTYKNPNQYNVSSLSIYSY